MNNAVLKATPTLHNGGQRVLRIGGGHNLNFENITITGGSISSDKDGGGINISGASHITLSNGTRVTGNYAGRNGGGVYINAGTLTIAGADISNNTAHNSNGGGVYVNNSTVIFTSGAISGNTGGNGGGIAINGNSFFKMDGGNIYGNYANPGYGGGVRIFGGTMSYDSGSIKTNANNNSKSIHNNGGTLIGTIGTSYSGSISIDFDLP